jgi:hypothetical protein
MEHSYVLDTAHFIGKGTVMQDDDILCENSGTLSNEGSMVSEGSTVALYNDGHVMVQLNDSSLILPGQILHLEFQQLTMPHCSCLF